VSCDVHGGEGRIISLLHAVFYTRVATNLPLPKMLSCPHVTAHPVCICHLLAYAPFFPPLVTLPPPHTESIQPAAHNRITKTEDDITARSQFLHVIEKSSLSLTGDLHSMHTTSLSPSHSVFYSRLICAITFCTAFATLGERPTPAVKFLPSMAYTIRRDGSCCNACASPMASATPKAWVE
jgi:hypothetical protein